MRHRALWTGVLLIGLLTAGPGQGQEGVDQMINGGFENGDTSGYRLSGNYTATVVTECAGAAVPESPVEGKYCLHVQVAAAGANNWDMYMVNGGHKFEKGKKYTFAAFMKSKSGTLQVRLKPEIDGDPWTGYNESVVTITDTWTEYYTTTAVMAADVSPTSPTFHFGFSAGDFWIDGIRLFEGDYVPPEFLKVFTATDPSPEDGATDVPREVVLGWGAGPYAQTHDVYLGTSFDDVNNATTSTAGVLVSAGQSETSFDPEGPLGFGQTYYWRVDEVNAPAAPATFKGAVWSFTSEPFTYPVENIIATASSSDKTTTGPGNTVNGSGLADDLHGTVSTDMWLSSAAGTLPAWIQYKFDRAYKLDEMWVWNYNVEFEPVLGYGFKDVTIEYSLDGSAWTVLSDVQFDKATAQTGYAHNTTVDFGGVLAQYVRLTANSNWSPVGLKQYGLSEVRFYQEPVVAREPSPADGDDDVSLSPTLSWRPGREAVSHKVYFGSDEQAVIDGTASASAVTTNSYPVEDLAYGTVYYWRVDEINEAADPAVRVGDVWSFTTTDHFVVDDFESYDDDENRIYDTWVDGYTTKDNGSTVGYLEAIEGTFGESVIVHGGSQSMPFFYDNTGASYSAYFSQAYREFSPAADWTVKGVTDLVLYVRGYPAVGEVAVAETGGKMTVTGAGADIEDFSDQFTFAYKTLPGDGSLVARVTSNGTGSNTWAKGGVMIRDSLDGGSAHAMVVMTGGGGNGAAFQYRNETDGDTTSVELATAVAIPYYVKISMVSGQITAYVSADGKDWKSMGVTTPTMTAPIYIGFAVTSHEAGVNRTYEFDNIAATGATGSWQGAAISSSMHNSPEDFFVTLQDSGNKSATVSQADVVTASDWAEVRIPLADFSGVNPAKVKRLYVGVGNPANPVVGDSGWIYIDDIQVGRVVERVYENLLANGDFETGVVDPWIAYGATITAVQTDPAEGSYCMEVTVPSKPANFWESGLKHTPHVFEAGKKYTVSAFCKCDQGTRQINFKPEQDGGSYTGYGEHTFTMTTEWAEYTTTTPEMTSTVTPVSITFHVGYAVGTFWMDCVRFYEGDYVAPEL
ncbi:MAG: carbohydrate binding domain-containing protein [Phycisphaerae bacterium]|nr:carbohydrate binding domain-containing protein [Phycisphaerae bacterium]